MDVYGILVLLLHISWLETVAGESLSELAADFARMGQEDEPGRSVMGPSAKQASHNFDPRTYREPEAMPVNPKGGVARPWVNWVRGMQAAAPFDVRGLIMDLFQRVFTMIFAGPAAAAGAAGGSLYGRLNSDRRFRSQKMSEFKRTLALQLKDLRSRYNSTLARVREESAVVAADGNRKRTRVLGVPGESEGRVARVGMHHKHSDSDPHAHDDERAGTTNHRPNDRNNAQDHDTRSSSNQRLLSAILHAPHYSRQERKPLPAPALHRTSAAATAISHMNSKIINDDDFEKESLRGGRLILTVA